MYLLVAIDCAIPKIKLALGLIAWILAVPDRTSVSRVASMILGVILVNGVKFAFGSGAEIIIVAKFVIVWKVT